MNDPLPENIEGSKRVAHSVEHRINWGYVCMAVAGLIVARVLYRALVEDETDPNNQKSGL